MAANPRYIGLTELAQDVVNMLTNIADGPVKYYANAGLFPAVGVKDKLYVDEQESSLYIWGGSNYIPISGGGDVAGVIEFNSLAEFPASGEINTLYIAKDESWLYRWGGAAYAKLIPISNATTSDDGLMSAADKTKLDGLQSYSAATTSVDGLMSSTDKTKLNGVATNANNYSHPTTDGNKHVPANGITNNNKVLKSGATAGTYTWSSVLATEVTYGATNVGAFLDTVVADSRAESTQPLIVEVRTSDPVSPAVGRIWVRSDL